MKHRIHVARQSLRRKIDECHRLDAELRELENDNFRVCVFGSARTGPDDPLYWTVYDLARSLADEGIDVITGGGPGLMEAANRGVRAASGGGASYGLPILLPSLSEDANRHLDIRSDHRRFSTRLDEFVRLSHAVVLAPGGVGTLLELGYIWQLIQLGEIEVRPVVLLNREFWQGLLDWSREQQLGNELLDLEDLQTLRLADTVEEALPLLLTAHREYQALAAAASAPAEIDSVERSVPVERPARRRSFAPSLTPRVVGQAAPGMAL